MRIKRYEAEEEKLPLVMRQVRIDLGEDAVVKTRRYRKGGVFGYGAKNYVEVIAGIDDMPAGRIAAPVAPPPVSFIPQKPPKAKTDVSMPSPATRTSLTAPDDRELSKLKREVSMLRDMLMSEGGIKAAFETTHDVPVITQTIEPDGMISCRDLRNRLMESEVADEILGELLDKVIVRLKEGEPEAALVPTAREEAIDHIVQLLRERSQNHPRIDKRVFAFIGPTGVGKTTTLAKLAANYGMLDERSFGIVTADTYRVAAIDQLRSYAQIMGVPLKVVHNSDEMSEAIASFDDRDFVFVDTAGRSPSNGTHLSDLQNLLSSRDDISAYLLLSATTRFRDMLHIRRAFEHPALRGVVFTKIDETTTYGPMLSLLYASRLPIYSITNGQEVPEDIILTDEDDLLRLLVRRCVS